MAGVTLVGDSDDPLNFQLGGRSGACGSVTGIAASELKIVRKRVSSLKPSPENTQIYDKSDSSDLWALADSIRKGGLHEALIITEDNFVVSGHRRLEALQLIGQVVAPCRVLRVRRSEMPSNEYVALLRDCNRARNKSVAEEVRETLIDIDPDDAIRNLRARRIKSVDGYVKGAVSIVEVEGTKKRWKISEQKADHVKYVLQVVFKDRKDYWPLSVRGIHYPLLNYTFYRNIPLKLRYRNDDRSYASTSDLTTRLRLNGKIPWEAIDDETRPITDHRPYCDVREYIRQERANLFCGYWRDLLQTQPHFVVVLVEKNTAYHMVRRVTDRFQIPTFSGRGFSSIAPWKTLYDRYIHSGKKRLVTIVLSDFDPEGEMIPHVGGRTLRDDFGVKDIQIIKAGVTKAQIRKYNLPPQNFAKDKSSNHDWFVTRNGGDNSVYELEALDPADMLRDLEAEITSVLDMDLFNREVDREKQEAVYLETAQKAAAKALEGLAEWSAHPDRPHV